MFVLRFTPSGLADVRSLPKNVKNSLRKELFAKLSKDPQGCSQQLHGELAGYWSFHWRQYRVVLRVFPDRQAVVIVGIGKHSREVREDVYRRLEALVDRGKLAELVLVSLRGFSERP